MNKFEDIFEKLFFERYKEILNLGKIELFERIYKWCEEETGITNAHLSPLFKTTISERYLLITEGVWLNVHISLDLEELIIHGPEKIEIVNSKKRYICDLNLKTSDYLFFLETLTIKYGIVWNHNSPFSSFFGELNKRPVRFSLIHQSLSFKEIPKLFIRFISNESIPHHAFGKCRLPIKLEDLILSKKNILICGATGSGKTTFLSSLIQLIPSQEHVVILEDTPEIRAPLVNWTRLVSDENNSGKRMIDLCAYSMRMRPDRIILGEMRSHEVISFLLGLNSGHRGCMSTVHATSAPEALYRLALLFELYSSKGSMSEKKVMELVCRNIDYIFYLENKKIKEIIRVIGFDGEKPFYEEIFNDSFQLNNHDLLEEAQGNQPLSMKSLTKNLYQ